MTPKQGLERQSEAATTGEPSDYDWLLRVAEGASRDAGVSDEFLGDYLPMLADAATFGSFPDRAQVDACGCRGAGHRSRECPPVGGVDLYLSAARRVWSELPASIRERDNAAVRAAAAAVLQVVDDAVAAFAEGHAEAGREMIRREETLRRELVEDLLRGDAHLSELAARAEPFGLDLSRAHQVALAQPGRRLSSITAATTVLERVVLDRFGDRDVLVATKEGRVVVLALADATGAPSTSQGLVTTGDLGKIVHGRAQRAAERFALARCSGASSPGGLRDRPLLRGGA